MNTSFLSPGGVVASLALVCLATAGCSRAVSGPVGGPADIGATDFNDRHDGEGDPRARVPGAQTTIARKMPQFRRCFERMEATGKISLILTIGPEGKVYQARASGRVPREVMQCVESKALTARFSAPEGHQLARLDVPVAIYDQ